MQFHSVLVMADLIYNLYHCLYIASQPVGLYPPD